MMLANGANVFGLEDALPHLAKLVAGKQIRVINVTISACEIMRRADENSWTLYLFMTFPLTKLDID